MKMTHRYHFLGGPMARQIRQTVNDTIHDPLDGLVNFAPTEDQIAQYVEYKRQHDGSSPIQPPPEGPQYRIVYSYAETIEPTPVTDAEGQATYYLIPSSVMPDEEAAFLAQHVAILYREEARLRQQLAQK